MSSCQLSIELAKPEGIYQIGEPITGCLKLVLEKEVQAQPLKLDLSWFTHGKGNRDSGGLQSLELHRGMLEPGEHSFAFEFVIESGPLSYHGEFINVDWQIEARLDLAWKLDPKIKQAIFVRSPTSENRIDAAELYMEDSQPFAQRAGNKHHEILRFLRRGLPVIALGLFFLFGPGKNLLGIDLMPELGGFDFMKFSFFAVFGLVVSFVVYQVLRNKLAERKLGKVEFALERSDLTPGEQVMAKVNFKPLSDQPINAIYSSLRATERAVSGSGTNRVTHSRVIYNSELELPVKALVKSRKGFEHQWQFDLPRNAPLGFCFDDNSLDWSLELYIDIPNCADWTKKLSFDLSSPQS